MNGRNRAGGSDMDCRSDLQDFLDYLAGVMTGDTAHLFEVHLQECHFCAEMLEALRSVTPETTRETFEDVDIERVRSEWNGTLSALQPLKQWLDGMVGWTLENLRQLIERTFPGPAGMPLFSAVRSGNTPPVRMDIINMTSIPMREDRLTPSIEEARWLLSGCPFGFLHHDAYLLLLPLSSLKELIPDWNPADSQDQLTAFLKDVTNGLTMPGISVTSGRFIDRQGTVTLALDIPPEIDHLLRATDRMTAAILIV